MKVTKRAHLVAAGCPFRKGVPPVSCSMAMARTSSRLSAQTNPFLTRTSTPKSTRSSRPIIPSPISQGNHRAGDATGHFPLPVPGPASDQSPKESTPCSSNKSGRLLLLQARGILLRLVAQEGQRGGGFPGHRLARATSRSEVL
ncbi:hypothetical protein E2C01_049489 [Portunus trituberculatus]|uniref:Uncharacterized protein n=1 Tax=Portunus trituberculatus TaxID=210409 RepID=A0A5B7GEI8_PORTR|nr:hypothetical protein [Portunus trituberculatus]